MTTRQILHLLLAIVLMTVCGWLMANGYVSVAHWNTTDWAACVLIGIVFFRWAWLEEERGRP